VLLLSLRTKKPASECTTADGLQLGNVPFGKPEADALGGESFADQKGTGERLDGDDRILVLQELSLDACVERS
jgi:hypothetical protein